MGPAHLVPQALHVFWRPEFPGWVFLQLVLGVTGHWALHPVPGSVTAVTGKTSPGLMAAYLSLCLTPSTCRELHRQERSWGDQSPGHPTHLSSPEGLRLQGPYCKEGLMWITEGRPGVGTSMRNWWFSFLFLFLERAEIRFVFLGWE